MNNGSKTDYDVVILGDGTIGAVLALELNYRVAVIELRQPSFEGDT